MLHPFLSSELMYYFFCKDASSDEEGEKSAKQSRKSAGAIKVTEKMIDEWRIAIRVFVVILGVFGGHFDTFLWLEVLRAFHTAIFLPHPYAFGPPAERALASAVPRGHAGLQSRSADH